jgi:hypothetical protein
MNDMSSVIVPKSDQINAEDFLAGPRTFTIEGVAISPGTEQPVSIKLVGEQRVFRPCKSMSRVLVGGWGPDASAYVGRSLTLYRDPKVKWGGLEVGGIRISHMSHIERDMVLSLTATKGKRAPHQVKVLQGAPVQQQTARQSAEDWLDGHLAAIEAADTLDALAEVTKAAEKALDKLRDKHPTLHDRARAAALLRTEALTPSEGRADAGHGEQHTDDHDPF